MSETNSNNKESENLIQDLGFGSKFKNSPRFLNKDGSFNVKRKGGSIFSPYHFLVEVHWLSFLFITLGIFVLINAVFASLYVALGPSAISGIEPQSFLENFAYGFFLSVQTFTSVGYGALSPLGFWSNVLASLNAFVGLLAFALATGLVFARFSKPEARFLYSDNALITPYDDKMSLQFRVANLMNNKIINLSAKVTITWTEVINGEVHRRYASLPLERDKIFLFPLNWTIVHIIDEKSPLYQKTKKEIEEMNIEIITLLEGYDETYAHEIHDNYSYSMNELLWDVKFVMMFEISKTETTLDLSEINRVEKL